MRASLAVLLACSHVLAQDSRPADFAAGWSAICAELHASCEKQGVVGASILLVRGRKELGFEAHGFADRDAGKKVDRDTIFHWASITKTFTGIALVQLRDRKKLALDQPALDLVPELAAVHDPFGPVGAITLRHLLTHSAGFRGPTWPWGGDKPWHQHEPTEWSQLVAMLPYTEVEFAPGSRFSYSNPGIVFAARAIPKLTGDEYEVYMDKNVLRPLGMSHSYFDVTPWHLQKHRSHSYARKGDTAADRGADFDTGITVSNGGLNAPLPDMARYLAFLLGDVDPDSDAAGVLSRASLEEMWKPVLPTGMSKKSQVGICFFVEEHGGQTVVTHTGGQHEFVSFFHVHPASGTGALGAFNTGTAGPVMARMRTLLVALGASLAASR